MFSTSMQLMPLQSKQLLAKPSTRGSPTLGPQLFATIFPLLCPTLPPYFPYPAILYHHTVNLTIPCHTPSTTHWANTIPFHCSTALPWLLHKSPQLPSQSLSSLSLAPLPSACKTNKDVCHKKTTEKQSKTFAWRKSSTLSQRPPRLLVSTKSASTPSPLAKIFISIPSQGGLFQPPFNVLNLCWIILGYFWFCS